MLHAIFQYFWPQQLPRPICRRLWPIQQEHKYKRIRIRSYKGLKSLCKTVHESAHLGSFILCLWITMFNKSPNEAASERDRVASTGPTAAQPDTMVVSTADGDGGHGQVKLVEPVQLFGLLARLSRLRSLTLGRVEPALVDVVMFNSQGLLEFPHLVKFDIMSDGVIEVPKGVDADAWVRNLARLPALEDLGVFQPETSSALPPMQPILPLFASLTGLSLSGSDLGAADLPAIVDFAPHVIDLRLYDCASAPRYAKILRTAPTGLLRLALTAADGEPSEPRLDCLLDDILPRFGRLERLTLSAHSFTPGRLAPYLASLPALHDLTFDRETRPTDDLLRALFVDDKSPHRLRHLTNLEFDHVSSIDEPTLSDLGWVFPAGATSPTDDLDRTWRAPRWPEGCSPAGLEAAVAAARAVGIHVDGLAVMALPWNGAYAQERGMRLLVWGLRTGDYAQARAELGDAVIDQWVTALEKARLEADEKARLGTVEE